MNIGFHHSLVFFSSRFSAPWTSGGWLLHIVCCQSKYLFFSEFLTDHPALISIHSQYPLSLLHHPVLFYLEHLSLVNITVCSFFMCLLIFGYDPHMEGLYEQETCLFCPSLKSVLEQHLGHSCSVAKLHLTLCGSKDCSPPRLPCPLLSPRICSNSCPLSQWCYPLEWGAMPSSRGTSWPRDRISPSSVSCIGRQILYP